MKPGLTFDLSLAGRSLAIQSLENRTMNASSLSRSAASSRYDGLVAAIGNGDEAVLSRLHDFSEGKVRWRELVPELGLEHYGQLLDLMGVAGLPLYQVDAKTQRAMIHTVVEVLRGGP